MAPTMEVESLMPASSANVGSGNAKAVCSRTVVESLSDVSESCGDFDNSCETYFSGRAAIPEASTAFKETLEKMKLEDDQSFCKRSTPRQESRAVSPQQQVSSAPSLLTKLKSAFKPSSPRRSEGLPSLTKKSASNAKRPASFGGSDVVKPGSSRRVSQPEKRVSWADERGSDHPLFSVRLIKPRLSTDTAHVGHRTPAHSILRNAGTF